MGRTLSSASIKRDYYRGSQDSLAIRGNVLILFISSPAYYDLFDNFIFGGLLLILRLEFGVGGGGGLLNDNIFDFLVLWTL